MSTFAGLRRLPIFFGLLILCAVAAGACKGANKAAPVATEESNLVHPCDASTVDSQFGVQPARLADTAPAPLPAAATPTPAPTPAGTGGGGKTTGRPGCRGRTFGPAWAAMGAVGVATGTRHTV